MCPAKDGVEDTEHYLLCSQSYEEPRRELLNGFNEILPPSVISNLSNELLVEFLLYGNERLPPDVNKRLIEATLKFVQCNQALLNSCCKPPNTWTDLFFVDVALDLY